MKILLIDANIAQTGGTPTLGLAGIQGYLHRQSGHRSRILDLTFEGGRWPQAVSEAIRFEAPDAVGISFLISNRSLANDIAVFVKRQFGLRTIFGGASVILDPEEAMRCDAVDIACIGEGEETILELLDRGLDGRGVHGIWYRDGEAIVRNPQRALREDLDGLGFADFTDFDLRRYFLVNNGMLPILASRGCPYACSYCCNRRLAEKLGGRLVRRRSVGHVLDEIGLRWETLRDQGLQYLYFYDPTFILHRDFTLELCARYTELGYHRRLPWSANVRADLVTEEIIGAMRDAGCVEVRMAVESGNDHVRNAVYRRNMTGAQIENATRIVKRHGVLLRTYYMFGAPCETEEMIEESVALARSLPADQAIFFALIPLPGSDIRDLCEREGVLPGHGRPLSHYDIVGAVDRTKFVSARQLRRIATRIHRWQIGNSLREGWSRNGPGFLSDLARVVYTRWRQPDLGMDLYRSTVARYQLRDTARERDARTAR